MYLKKRYFLLLFFLFIPLFFTSVFATNNVKSVKDKKIYYKPNNTIYFYSIYEYNTQGQLIKKTFYNLDGSIDFYFIYEYNTQGQLIKKTCYNPDGSIEGYLIYEYNAQGQLIKSDGSIENYFIYEYNTQGQLIKQTTYNSDGSINHYFIYEYNTQNEKIKRTIFRLCDSFFFRELFDFKIEYKQIELKPIKEPRFTRELKRPAFINDFLDKILMKKNKVMFKYILDFKLHFNQFLSLISDFFTNCFCSLRSTFCGKKVGWLYYFDYIYDKMITVFNSVKNFFVDIVKEPNKPYDKMTDYEKQIHNENKNYVKKYLHAPWQIIIDIIKFLCSIVVWIFSMFKGIYEMITGLFSNNGLFNKEGLSSKLKSTKYLDVLGAGATGISLTAGASLFAGAVMSKLSGGNFSLDFEKSGNTVKECTLIVAKGLLVAHTYMLKFVSFTFSFLMKLILFFLNYVVLLFIHLFRLLTQVFKLTPFILQYIDKAIKLIFWMIFYHCEENI
ncbi:RHS repeat domain-containing protein [Candidatus Phytoplasma solani]|uniref:RHS repeat domain-containing protein n=1 Tax=Candidatus Phytoplasma solani TaxID=69896 RepID=UPI00358ED6C4